MVGLGTPPPYIDLPHPPGLRDSWATFWAQTAKQFADNPFVLGYELINEPFAGKAWGRRGYGINNGLP